MMPPLDHQPSVSDLLARGDLRAAAELLVVHHGGEVLGFCNSLVSDRDAAEDLAQEVFSRAFTALGDFRGESSPRTWLLTIARNLCFDHLRRRRRTPIVFHDEDEQDTRADDAPLPAEVLSDREQLLHAFQVLEEPERALVMLRFRHGLDYRELAEVFGVKPGTARMRLCRALAQMREALRELEVLQRPEELKPGLPDAAPAVRLVPERQGAGPARRRGRLKMGASGREKRERDRAMVEPFAAGMHERTGEAESRPAATAFARALAGLLPTLHPSALLERLQPRIAAL